MTARRFKQIGDLKDILSQGDAKESNKLDQEQEEMKQELKSFKAQWRAKRKQIREEKQARAKAAAKPRARRGARNQGAAPPEQPPALDDIDEVRMRRRAGLPHGTLEQSDLASRCPPGASIWNNWRGGAWRILVPGYGGDNESWREHGWTNAGLKLVARWWRTWLEDHGMPMSDCPVDGLLDNF